MRPFSVTVFLSYRFDILTL